MKRRCQATTAQSNSQSQLPDTTEMGVVELKVSDLAGMRDYYVNAVELEILGETDELVSLGYGSPVLQLAQGDGETYTSPSQAGLYHSAILYPDESSLASVLYNLATVAPQSFQGSADHAVSLAFYFVDPEGNGLELYVDTPRSEWKWVNGEEVTIIILQRIRGSVRVRRNARMLRDLVRCQ